MTNAPLRAAPVEATAGTVGEADAAPYEGASAARKAARLGVALMLLAMLLFSMNDVMGKWLVATYSVGQVLLMRSGAALLLLLPFLWRIERRAVLRPERPKIQFLRVLCSTVEVFCFYAAVIYLPLADVMTYWLAAPIYVAALSPLLLGERVGWRRWTAIVIGFAGVLVALEPSAATLTGPALISVLGSFLFGLTMIYGRQLRQTPDTVLVFWHILGAALVGLVTAPFGWVTPSWTDFAMLSALGIVAMVAHVCVNRALKLSPASTVAPLQYTLLVWAILFGWLVFDEVPRTAMLAGAAIIVASGLFIAFRERKLGKPPVTVEPG